jgi:hypothetical protein
MPIQSTNPIEVDGNVYPYFMINLAISPLVKPTDVGGSVAMRLTPYRVLEDGTSESLGADYQIPIVYMDVFESGDNDALKATMAIMGAIQEFIIDKGI